MAKRSVTSADVARLARVSQSAVSRSFSPGASVSEDMRRRVLAAAERLGYRPNAIARAMISGRSRLIALLAAYLDNHFYPVLLEQLARALQARQKAALPHSARAAQYQLHVVQRVARRFGRRRAHRRAGT